MKHLVFFIILIKFICAFSQINIGSNFNYSIYRPFSHCAQEYLKKNNDLTSFTVETNISYEFSILHKQKFFIGVAYKFISLQINGTILSYTDKVDGQKLINYTQFDQLNKSNSIGLNLGYKYCFYKKEKLRSEIDVSSVIYFIEFYNEYLRLNNNNKNVYLSEYAPQLGFDGVPVFFFSSANLSIGYKQFLLQKEKFNLGAKVSVGTNLYSDWDLFRKYVWLGVGLEMGFGKGKALFGEKKK